MTGRQKIELVNSILIVILNILLNLFFIPLYKEIGAAIATCISIVLINFLRLTEVFYIFRIHPYNLSYWKPVVAGVVSYFIWFGVTIFIPIHGYYWIPGALILSIIYILFILLFRFDEDDIVILYPIKEKFDSYF
jgi:O-antigen/teichoic acid export membrane protein